jgi:hypothetical protein
MKVIEFVAGGGDLRRVSEADFRALRQELLDACRSHVRAGAGPLHQVCNRVEALVEPWLTPRALAMADHETLQSLLQSCVRVKEEMAPARQRGAGRWLLVLVCLLVTLGVGWYLPYVVDSAPSLRPALRSMLPYVKANPLHGAAVAVPILLAAVWLFRRSTRA